MIVIGNEYKSLKDTFGKTLADVEDRKRLLAAADQMREFAASAGIPEKAFRIEDNYNWISIDFTAGSDRRNDLVLDYSFTCCSAGICSFDVSFATPRLSDEDEEEKIYDEASGKYCDGNTTIFHDRDDSASLWSINLEILQCSLTVEKMQRIYHKIATAAAEIMKKMEMSFWKHFSKSCITSYMSQAKPERFRMFDGQAELDLYEGQTLLGRQAFVNGTIQGDYHETEISISGSNITVRSRISPEYPDEDEEYTYTIVKKDDCFEITKICIIDPAEFMDEEDIEGREVPAPFEYSRKVIGKAYQVYDHDIFFMEIGSKADFYYRPDYRLILAVFDTDGTTRIFRTKDPDENSGCYGYIGCIRPCEPVLSMVRGSNRSGTRVHNHETLMKTKYEIELSERNADECFGLLAALPYIREAANEDELTQTAESY